MPSRPRPLRRLPPTVRLLVGFAAMIAVYYLVPVEAASGGQVAGTVLGLVVGVALLGWAVLGHVRQPTDESSTVIGLLMLLALVVVVFAFGFYLLQRHDPSQFADLSTRTDALYFTLTVLSTVGFGDVHPVGQTARVLVAGQIVFDLAFVGLLVNAVTERLRERRHRRSDDRGAEH